MKRDALLNHGGNVSALLVDAWLLQRGRLRVTAPRKAGARAAAK